MKVIHPNEIGNKISTLLYNAHTFVRCVTPFVHIREWKKILINLQRAREKGVDIQFIVREINPDDQQLLARLGIPVYFYPYLHAKLYVSDAEAIVSSMNLYEFSDNHSVEIALHFTAPSSDYDQLMDYFRKYIHKGVREEEKFTPNPYPLYHLEQLHQDLKRLYPLDRINRTDNYVYFTKVAPAIDAFVEGHAICLKSTLGNKEVRLIEQSYRTIEQELHRQQLELISRNSRYWQIPMQENTALKTKPVLDSVRQLFL